MNRVRYFVNLKNLNLKKFIIDMRFTKLTQKNLIEKNFYHDFLKKLH